MIYIFLIGISCFISHAQASRSVPLEYVLGIENMLPANYNQLFEIEDKTSNDYVVIAFQITSDLLHIAQESKKTGNYLLCYRFLRLANFLFPHRGDVSQKYQLIGKEIVHYLNNSALCNDSYERLLQEVKKSFPVYLDLVKQEKCADINESVRDIGHGIIEKENKILLDSELQSLANQEKIRVLTKKTALNENDKVFLRRSLIQAYLGQLEFVSTKIDTKRTGSVVVEFELIRKNSSMSFKGFKNTWQSIIGEEFQEGEPLLKVPLKFVIHLIQNNKVTIYPLSIHIKNANSFDVWLKTINFYNYSQYPDQNISYRNDAHGFNFATQGIEMTFYQGPNLNLLFNQIEIKNIPAPILNNLKKVTISSIW